MCFCRAFLEKMANSVATDKKKITELRYGLSKPLLEVVLTWYSCLVKDVAVGTHRTRSSVFPIMWDGYFWWWFINASFPCTRKTFNWQLRLDKFCPSRDPKADSKIVRLNLLRVAVVFQALLQVCLRTELACKQSYH